MNKQISVLGTGWLGLPLSKALIEEGYRVNGATTSENKLEGLKKEGLQAYRVSLTEEGPVGDIISFLEGSETLIINIPPGLRRNPEIDFIAKIRKLIPYIEKSTIQNLLFISSTSVFVESEAFPLISEETLPNAVSNAGKQLIKAEHLLQESKTFKTTILRFAGLFDSRRHPATMLSRRSSVKNPKAPVNLIHLDDCIGIIKKIIKTNTWKEIFNASFPSHPEKAKYYTAVCKKMQLPIPDYDFDLPSKGKIINSEKLVTQLAYKFKKSI